MCSDYNLRPSTDFERIVATGETPAAMPSAMRFSQKAGEKGSRATMALEHVGSDFECKEAQVRGIVRRLLKGGKPEGVNSDWV